jgi:hypothetical protein
MGPLTNQTGEDDRVGHGAAGAQDGNSVGLRLAKLGRTRTHEELSGVMEAGGTCACRAQERVGGSSSRWEGIEGAGCRQAAGRGEAAAWISDIKAQAVII